MTSYIELRTDIECRVIISICEIMVLKPRSDLHKIEIDGCINEMLCVDINDESMQFHAIVKDGDRIYIKKTDFKRSLTYVSKQDVLDGIADKSGIIYSRDGLKLMKCLNKDIKHYKVRKGCVVICDSAFSGCNKLKRITLPNSLTHIGNSAFEGCLNANFFLSKCSDNTLYKNSNTLLLDLVLFRNAILPQNIKHIGERAFFDCNKLYSISLPDSIEYIGGQSFALCESLVHINLPKQVSFLGNDIMWNCKKITSIHLPSNLQYICDNAFNGCCQIREIDIQDCLIGIGDYAFRDCKALTSINIKQKVNIEHTAEKCDREYFPVAHQYYNLSVIGDSAFLFSSLWAINIPLGAVNYFKYIFPATYHSILKEKI